MKKDLSILAASLMAGEGVVNGFTEALRKTFTGGYYSINPGHADFNQELVRMVLNLRPDIVFVQTQNAAAMHPHIAQEISKYSFCIGWSGDIRWTTEQFYKSLGQYFQLTCFSNQRDVDDCIKSGVRSDFLQIGYDPQIFKPLGIPKVEQDSVVALFNNYAGSFELSNYREEICMTLLREFPNQFSIYGNGWNGRERGNLNHSQHAENEKLNQARIAINVSNFLADRYSSDRIFRSIGSGVMVISHRFPNMHLDFEENKHLACFDTIPQLVEKIRYYLSHDEERESIARAGNELAKERFTFLNMAQEIQNLYYKHSGIPQGEGIWKNIEQR